jgi:hypothetical protein
MTVARYIAPLIVGFVLSASAFAQYVPPRGFVPDAQTAISVARAVLIPIYGAVWIKNQEPLVAEERTDRWIVRGTLCPNQPANSCQRGVAEIEIAKSDGRILRVIHSQ